jgi:creatinine amidohydrolase
MDTDAPRPYLLREATHKQLLAEQPNLAVLPWGATEAHNRHLPYATDVIEAETFAERAAALAHARGARLVVLPAIPFGNNEQQLDQVATISLTTATARAVLGDVVRSLKRQGIERLAIVNSHGGNEFRPLVRDLTSEHNVRIVVANFWQMRPDLASEIFDEPGDHAGELETSLLLDWQERTVQLGEAGTGEHIPIPIAGLAQPGVWTPRPWSKCQPDLGCGDPARATAEKGRRYAEAVCEAIADLLVGFASASREDLFLD